MRLILLIVLSVGLYANNESYWDRPCPFCDQIQVEKQLVSDGKEAFVLYSLTPMAEGNVLVVPKRHVTRFEELSDGEMAEIQALIQKMVPVYEKLYGVSDYFVFQKNGINAGQSVPHLHFQVVPCKEHIQKIVAKSFLHVSKLSDDEMRDVCARIKPFLDAR